MQIFKFMVPEIIFGKGTLRLIGESARRLGATKVFLVSDEGVARAGWIDQAVRHLKDVGLEYQVWTEPTPNPKDYEVERGKELYLEGRCDAIIGLGGGSAIDAAKAVAILATNGGKIQDYEGVDKIEKPIPPLICVATTAGSGGEVTQFTIVVDSKRKVKMTIGSKSLVPDIAIIDPLLLSTIDAVLTANTGMDALTHAIEAYVSVAATPITDVLAYRAIQMIGSSLRASVASRTNMEAKIAMAMASLLAGIAMSNAILGAVHAMAHPLGGLLNLPHGEANAILLPHVMRFNLIACTERYAEIAQAMGEKVEGLSTREAAEKAIEAVERLCSDIGAKRHLSEIGLQEEHIWELSRVAAEDVSLITNPRDATVEQIAEIYRAAL
ncbi:MAG: iron-containing alcohol dehydrogenase [Bacillota bacterium]|jgi:alcohol dehydrogenase class IV|nr:iron-containing alcohol dehydrogenase [Bacillota bacterium]